MNNIAVNTSYFQHSTPEYNKKHKEEISEYNHEYYEENKEKWADNESGPLYEKYRNLLSTLNGGSKKAGSSKGKKSSGKASGEKKEKEPKEKTEKTENKSSENEDKNSDVKDKSTESLKDEYAELEKKLNDKDMEHDKVEKIIDRMHSIKNEVNKRDEDKKEEKKEDKEEEKKEKDDLHIKLTTEEDIKKKHDGPIIENSKNKIPSHGDQGTSSKKIKVKNNKIKHSSIYIGVNSQPYFEHHGRLGMKWGKKNGPPYPLDYSKLSEEERAKDKQRVKEEGDIESVSYKKNRSYFSDQEINEVINRYQLNSRINQLAADSAKMKAGKSKTEELTEKLQKATEVGFKLANGIQAGSNVYNNVAKIMNAFGDKDLPIIGQQKQKEKKEFKATKKELDKMIENLETGMGKMTNQELQDALKRKTMYDSLVKDRDAKRAADKQAEIDKKNAEQAAYVEKLKQDADEAAKFKSGSYRINYKRR